MRLYRVYPKQHYTTRKIFQSRVSIHYTMSSVHSALEWNSHRNWKKKCNFKCDCSQVWVWRVAWKINGNQSLENDYNSSSNETKTEQENKDFLMNLSALKQFPFLHIIEENSSLYRRVYAVYGQRERAVHTHTIIIKEYIPINGNVYTNTVNHSADSFSQNFLLLIFIQFFLDIFSALSLVIFKQNPTKIKNVK